MYDYRKMTPKQRADVIAQREARGFPWHLPPHSIGENTYMLTAACFEHNPILRNANRLSEFADALLEGFEQVAGGAVHAWVVLPNHWHLLGRVDLAGFRKWIGRLHNGKSTQWNREDDASGRQVWYRFSDRRVRNEAHFNASMNYIHANPVKHRYVDDSRSWPWSSLPAFMEKVGRDTMLKWWKEYPVKDYGKGWDD